VPGRAGLPGKAAFAPAAAAAVRRQKVRQWAALALLAVGGLAGLFVLLQDGHGQAPQQQSRLFRGWGRPDVAVVLSGEMRGYLQPCGCSWPQLGGLSRRYNFIEGLRRRGWTVACAEVGDVAERSGPQRLLKYETAMKALRLMDYTAVSVGQFEMALPLFEALSHYALNNPRPRVLAANLVNPVFKDMVGTWEVVSKPGAPRVGVTAIIGPSVASPVNDPDVKLAPQTSQVVRQVLGQLQVQKTDLVVLLYQGSLKEARLCAKCAADCRAQNPNLPRVDVVQCLCEEDEPPGVPDRVGHTLIVRVGHKGRFVGVVGAFHTDQPGQPYDLRYQLVPIGPDYDTPEGKEAGNPVMGLMEDYAEAVKKGNFLTQYPRSLHPVQLSFPNARYVGSGRCSGCHTEAYHIWEKTWVDAKGKKIGHSHAYESLEEARNPRLRQYDGECVVCHVVGFAYKTGFTDEVTTARLKNVGCESCHGPCSEHVKDTHNAKIHALINPWKAERNVGVPEARRRLRINDFCQTCHNIDNDVHWDFEKSWPKIIHVMPRKGAAQAPAAPQAQAPAVPHAADPAVSQPPAAEVNPTQPPAAAPPPRSLRLFRRGPGSQ
jgi:hypothetical protein